MTATARGPYHRG